MLRRRDALVASVACALGAFAPGASALGASARAGGDPDLDLVDLRLDPGEVPFGGRVPVLVPRHVAPGAASPGAASPGGAAPLVIALHGLGESRDPALAARAWPELYGLVEAHRRLRAPPLAARTRRGDLPAERLAELNAQLAAQPFGGLLVACPFTPNPSSARDRGAHLDAYARWITEVVVPRARAQTGAIATARATHLVGCSMGGTVAAEIALRAPGAFGSLALVQSAHGAHRNAALATGLAGAGPGGGPMPTLVLTSRGDPFRERNEALARELAARKVPHELRTLPGPHDQPWLREAGTPELLMWLDRRPRR